MDDVTAAEAVARVAAVAGALPEVVEQDAWIGVRWRVRGRTFAQVLEVVDGRPPGIGVPLAAMLGGRAASPPVVLHVHASSDDVATLRHVGAPWFKTGWGSSSMGLLLSLATDWAEVGEAVVDSYRVRAPRYLAHTLP